MTNHTQDPTTVLPAAITAPFLTQALGKQIREVIADCTALHNLLITTCPDNNLECDKGIREGDGIVVDTGNKYPSTGGGSYLLRVGDAYSLRRVRSLHDGGLQLATPWHIERINPHSIDIIGKLIGSISVRRLA